jgi:hypothetical protein
MQREVSRGAGGDGSDQIGVKICSKEKLLCPWWFKCWAYPKLLQLLARTQEPLRLHESAGVKGNPHRVLAGNSHGKLGPDVCHHLPQLRNLFLRRHVSPGR